jgi:hypothetical protein
MAEAGGSTYARLLRAYVEKGAIHLGDSVFVQFAGQYDREICAQAGLTNCTFGNISPDSASSRLGAAGRFDAHRMPHPDQSFDHVIGHAGLHHCSRPHEALHEMYRMARNIVLFVENQDSALMRLAGRVGVVGYYEHAAVRDGGGTSGGVDGTGVPNYVYRWTRREVQKVVKSFDPGLSTPVEFYAEWNLGSDRVASEVLRRKLRIRSAVAAERLFSTAQRFLNGPLAAQGNIFAVAIRKDLAKPQPWMGELQPALLRDTQPG